MRDVLAPQVIDRTAGAAEHIAGAERARFGGEDFGLAAALAVTGRRRRLGCGARAIEAAIIAHKLGAGDGGLEVAPHDVAVAAFDAHIELAARRRVFNEGAVVAVDGIVAIGIELAQQIARILAVEVREHVAERLFARVGGGGDQRVALDFALEIEGEAAVDEDLVLVLVRVGGLQDVDRAGGRAFAGE